MHTFNVGDVVSRAGEWDGQTGIVKKFNQRQILVLWEKTGMARHAPEEIIHYVELEYTNESA